MDPQTARSDPPAGHVRLRYWAAARAAAGVEEDLLEVAAPEPLAGLRDRAKQLHSGSVRFAQVLDTCSVLLGDRPVGGQDATRVLVAPGATVEFLPPFAGG